MIFDIEALERLCEHLRLISDEFSTADSRSGDISDVIGEYSLGAAVREFSENWNDNRARIVEHVDFMRLYAAALASRLVKLDEEASLGLR